MWAQSKEHASTTPFCSRPRCSSVVRCLARCRVPPSSNHVWPQPHSVSEAELARGPQPTGLLLCQRHPLRQLLHPCSAPVQQGQHFAVPWTGVGSKATSYCPQFAVWSSVVAKCCPAAAWWAHQTNQPPRRVTTAARRPSGPALQCQAGSSCCAHPS